MALTTPASGASTFRWWTMADKTRAQRAEERITDSSPVEILKKPDPKKTVRGKPSATPIRRAAE